MLYNCSLKLRCETRIYKSCFLGQYLIRKQEVETDIGGLVRIHVDLVDLINSWKGQQYRQARKGSEKVPFTWRSFARHFSCYVVGECLHLVLNQHSDSKKETAGLLFLLVAVADPEAHHRDKKHDIKTTAFVSCLFPDLFLLEQVAPWPPARISFLPK